MDAKTRNKIAKESRGKMREIQLNNRAKMAAKNAEERTRTSRATMAPPVEPSGYTGRRTRARYAGSGDKGYGSAWTISPYYKTAATIDVRWSK